MKELTTLEQGALRAALMRLFRPEGHFSICDFDQMAKVYGAVPDRRDHEALRLLHCINWRDMDATTRKEAQAAVIRTFSPDNTMAELFVDAFNNPTQSKVSLFKRLMGGTA